MPKLLTGNSVDYYQLHIEHPTTAGRNPYIAECNDIIEGLNLTYAEATIFKAVWRSAAARQGNGKPGFEDGVYDAEKVCFFAPRMLLQNKARAGHKIARDVIQAVQDEPADSGLSWDDV